MRTWWAARATVAARGPSGAARYERAFVGILAAALVTAVGSPAHRRCSRYPGHQLDASRRRASPGSRTSSPSRQRCRPPAATATPVFSVNNSSGSGVCHVTGANGTTLNYTAAGSCVIDANQAGSSDGPRRRRRSPPPSPWRPNFGIPVFGPNAPTPDQVPGLDQEAGCANLINEQYLEGLGVPPAPAGGTAPAFFTATVPSPIAGGF